MSASIPLAGGLVLSTVEGALTPQIPLSLGVAVLTSVSALFSAALAETILSTVEGLASAFFSYVLLLILAIVWFHQGSRLLAAEAPSFGLWFRSWSLIVTPAHLLLPAALLCRPLGIPGLALYSLAQLAIGVVVIRRCHWAVRTLLRWPAWASALMTLSPFLVGSAVILIGIGLMVMAACAALVAALT